MSLLQIGTTPIHIPVSYGVKRKIGYVGDQLYVAPADVRAGESKKLESGAVLNRGCWVVSAGTSQVTLTDTDEPVQPRGEPKAKPKSEVQATPTGSARVENVKETPKPQKTEAVKPAPKRPVQKPRGKK